MTQSSADIVERLREFAAYGGDAKARILAQLALTEIERLRGGAATPSMRDALTTILAHPVDMDERPIRGDVSNEKCFWLRVSGKDYTAAKDALTGTLAQCGREAREKEITRLATIAECAKIADDFAAYEQTVIDRAFDDGALSETGRKTVVAAAGSRQIAAEQIAHDIRVLALPSTVGDSE